MYALTRDAVTSRRGARWRPSGGTYSFLVGGVLSRPSDEHVLAAPEQLGLATRKAFRQQALRLLDGLAGGSDPLVLDLQRTRTVDSTGFNALVLIKRDATERGVAVRLRGVRPEVGRLLRWTKLDRQFDIEAAPS